MPRLFVAIDLPDEVAAQVERLCIGLPAIRWVEPEQLHLTVRFVGELTSVVRNKTGEVIEGSPTSIKRQRDLWTFGRRMGVDDPNWQLTATGE